MFKFFKRLITSLLVLWLTGFGGFFVISQKMKREGISTQTEAIIVLTGGRQHRITEGLNLLALGAAPELFISGVHKDVTENEIKAMHKGASLLPECCIILGRTATTTIENAVETKNWLTRKNIKSIRLVTSNYHMPRAALEFKSTLSGVKILLHPIKAGTYPLDDFRFWRLTFDEYNKFLYRFAVIMIENAK